MAELNVKVGDKVLYSGGYSFNAFEKISEVVKVTPTGRIKIKDSDSQFDKYGNEMGKKDRWTSHSRISELTEEDCERVKKNNAIFKAVYLCGKVDKKTLSYEQAVKIIEILGDES